MNLLLDTHMLIWTFLDSEKLPTFVRNLIADYQNTIYFSMASMWEVEIKHIKNPVQMSYGAELLHELCVEADFKCLDIDFSHIMALHTLSLLLGAKPHHDPFDRLLISQAKASDMILITHDKLLSGYDEPCVYTV